MPRTIGILLHPTSLPGNSVCGTFGAPARKWLELLVSARISVWQLLPLCPVDSMGSPYSSPSCFALNPWFLDSQDLFEEGFITQEAKDHLDKFSTSDSSKLDFKIADMKSRSLGKYLREHWPKQNSSRQIAFKDWLEKQDWIDDYASFIEIRKQNSGRPWWEWAHPFASHDSKALNRWKSLNAEVLTEQFLLQWHLDRQLQHLRKIAKNLGVIVLGDMPFYVSRDSSDVWGNRSLFSVLSDGKLEFQSGVPPDYFSDSGQLWGTPVYKWRIHQLTEFKWWRKRFAHHRKQFDLLRLDHFRALVSYWSVLGDKDNAIDGVWEPSPGKLLLNYLKKDCGGNLPLIAEDLGVITPEVEALRDEYGLPGMKILQFAFDGNTENSYLPENILGNNWVVYTGTHDNPTTIGWWNKLNTEERQIVSTRFKGMVESPCWELIEMALSTQSKLVISPIQDLLCLDDHARFNTPGTIEGNWNWRLLEFDSTLRETLSTYGDRGEFWGRSFKEGVLLIN